MPSWHDARQPVSQEKLLWVRRTQKNWIMKYKFDVPINNVQMNGIQNIGP